MPIIDFPFYVTSIRLAAPIRSRSTIVAYATLNGRNRYSLWGAISGTAAIYPNITLDGETFVGAEINSTSTITANGKRLAQLGPVNISSTGYVFAGLTYSGGRGYIPTPVSFGSDYFTIQGVTNLPALYSRADGDFYVPPVGSRHYALLSGLTSTGLLADPNTGEAYLDTPISQGWLRNSTEPAYAGNEGVGYALLGPFIGGSAEGIRLEPLMFEYLFSFANVFPELDIVVTFSSSLSVADVYTASRNLIQNYLESLSIADSIAVLGTYQLSKVEALALTDLFLASVSGMPATFSDNTTTWVLNIDNQGTTQYDHFGFNSFCKRDTTYLAAADDGIYTLTGDSDEGFDISAEIDLAVSRFETPQKKYFPSVYLGVTSSGKLLLKATVDGQDWIYEANNTSANIANQRVDLGRGLSGSHWRFTILNQDGLDFDLESVEFLPLISSRRVY